MVIVVLPRIFNNLIVLLFSNPDMFKLFAGQLSIVLPAHDRFFIKIK
jgi:hypothetical protein